MLSHSFLLPRSRDFIFRTPSAGVSPPKVLPCTLDPPWPGPWHKTTDARLVWAPARTTQSDATTVVWAPTCRVPSAATVVAIQSHMREKTRLLVRYAQSVPPRAPAAARARTVRSGRSRDVVCTWRSTSVGSVACHRGTRPRRREILTSYSELLAHSTAPTESGAACRPRDGDGVS